MDDLQIGQVRPVVMGALPADVVALMLDQDASGWLRACLLDAVTRRDPLDALHDAQELATALESWTRHVFHLHGLDLPV